MENILVNEGKELLRIVDGTAYERYALQTKLIGKEDDMIEMVKEYALPHMQKGDILFMSEKAVACTQNRAIPLDEIKPGFLAKLLVKFVYRSPHGLGRTMPETMQVTIDLVGAPRVLFAAFCSAIGKLFKKRGIFYAICGDEVRAIDGPCPTAMPPLNKCVTLGPLNPEKVCREIADAVGYDVAVIDANDLGIEILGFSGKKNQIDFLTKVLADNPLCQGNQCTPMGIIRKAR